MATTVRALVFDASSGLATLEQHLVFIGCGNAIVVIKSILFNCLDRLINFFVVYLVLQN
jgi:hypothetical protein